jgi:ribA/ribD-fused uncharacterized protein
VTEEFIFYFSEDSLYSHWYKCDFFVAGEKYCCVEQYLMYRKAILFGDNDVAKKIMNSSRPSWHRMLGKQITGFDKKKWHDHCRTFSLEGNLAKFSQNPVLKEALMQSAGKFFAEASPYDRVWGIGLSLSNPQNLVRANWRGKNWAGESLDATRKELQSSFPK